MKTLPQLKNMKNITITQKYEKFQKNKTCHNFLPW